MGGFVTTQARRRDDWADALAAEIELVRDLPFEWGKNDCATFAAAVVASMTGTKVEVSKWRNSREACAELRDRGGVLAALEARAEEHGWNRRKGLPCRGDSCAIFDGRGRTIFAICTGRTLAAPGTDRLQFFRLENSFAAFEIPLKNS